jgi:outer membrane receptor protein involved in Fe transport
MKPFSVFIFVSLFLLKAWGQEGAVDILVSHKGLPLDGYEVMIGAKTYRTDAFGYVSVTLQEGEHILNIRDGQKAQTVPFKIQDNERTQLLVNIFSEGIVSDLTEPEKKEAKPLAGDVKTGELNLKILSVNGEPVAGAKVYARGTQISGTSNRAGSLQLKLPEGNQVVSVTHPKFSTQVIRNIQISQKDLEMRTVELTPTGLVLEDFVVLAPNLKGSIQALIEVRRKSADVADVMSAEQMSKSGDSDAAGSLKRVTGLTLKDGKYVYVRGLGERYSATLLNGVTLPSPDPSRRVVPLDLFPVQFLDSLIIQKSYSPNQPGEFGGGVVQLQTKSMPDDFFFKASLSDTVNSNNGNLQSGPTSSTDWLGVDDGSRKLPEGMVGNNVNPELIFTRNRHTLSPQQNRTLQDLSLSTGNSWKWGPVKTGFTLSGVYKDDINYRVETRASYREAEGGELVREAFFPERQITNKERTVGGIIGHQVKLYKNHSLTTNYINVRNTTDYVAVMTGNGEENPDATLRQTELEWAARTLNTIMLQGENKFPGANDLKINWHFAESKARRDEPNRSTYVYSLGEEGDFIFSPERADETYQRRFYNLSERVDDIGVSLESPFPWFNKRKGEVKLGSTRTRKTRKSAMRRWEPDYNPDVPCDADFTQNPDVWYSQCPEAFGAREETQPEDTYNATQFVDSYFFKTKFPLASNLSLSTGMRFEQSIQQVDTVNVLTRETELSELTTRNWLPGSTLTWKLNKKMQVRLAYSETISRPDLRELSNTVWQDFDTGYDVQGFSGLRATVIESYDARWEWYFAPKENLSVGAFFKEFDSPIETVFTAASDPRISYRNAEGSTLYGAEIEAAKNLGFMGMKHFTLSGNYAYIVSNIELGNIDNLARLDTNRPLQGQSPYTFNMLLDFEHEPTQWNASLAYNIYGRRIAFAGPEGLPDVWEMPVGQLDLVARKKFGKNIVLQAKIRNILNPEVRFEQGGRPWRTFRRGQFYTLGIGMEI